ncbi:low temperature requirement protein A [Microbulbifer taiwanensis]|uniref:Low temperature requirement protein A n=1 Tax=Microbulbifer taiwanensis TaxID=986746 RepID=A0ABW1YS55_9GAMM|nr:low temperature requirement protein A [Microbulbifer taiwanensis]
MPEKRTSTGRRWLLPMPARDPAQVHRQATPLELFFDLSFVIAVALAAAQLHHALSEGHIASGVASYLAVFFSIWWAWMNFTWFASAYDNGDVLYRLASLLQIVGTLILAAGVPRAFLTHDFSLVFCGYGVMRVGLVSLWLRAAKHDPERRTTALRFAFGVSAVMLGWAVLLISGWPMWGWWLMAGLELAVPLWAERAAKTSWHPSHIAERYGLFTIIVLGESILTATNAAQLAAGEYGGTVALYRAIGGGLLVVFSLWWLYFDRPAHRFLTSNRAAFLWGYGHYFIFAAAAAAGAGFAVNVDYITGHGKLNRQSAAAAFTLPVAVYLLALWLLHLRPHRKSGGCYGLMFPVAIVLVLASTFAGWPIPLAGLVCVLLVMISVISSSRN